MNEHVIHVYGEPSFSQFFLEDGVHHGLEGCRGVSESKEHYVWFEQSLIGDEGCFPLVSVFDSDVVVAPSDVELREEFCSFYSRDKLGDEWEWVAVLYCPFINLPIVLHWPELSVFLFDKEEGRCVGAFRRFDVSLFQMFVHEFGECFLFCLGQGVDLSRDCRGGSVFEFNCMIPQAGTWEALQLFLSEYICVSFVFIREWVSVWFVVFFRQSRGCRLAF